MYAPHGTGHIEDEYPQTEHQHHDAEEQFLADIVLFGFFLDSVKKAHL
jgi:hypothetical protein